MTGVAVQSASGESSVISPFDDELVNFSYGFAQLLGCSKALLLHHVWVTFAHHYHNPDNARFERPTHLGEGEKTWVYFTLETMAMHVPLTTRAIITALKELEAGGWIEVWRQKGKRTLYRPAIPKFCVSSAYRLKGAQFAREPDRYRKPEEAPWGGEETSRDKNVTGGVSSHAGVKKLHSNECSSFTGSHIPSEPRNEPRSLNGSARANALEGVDEGDGPGAEPGPDPAYEEGTGGDDPVPWEDAMSHEERVEAAARAYQETPMSKVQFLRTLKRFQVTQEEVHERVQQMARQTPPKTAALPSRGGGAGVGKQREPGGPQDGPTGLVSKLVERTAK